MTVKLDLTPDVEAGLLAQAQAQGLSLEEFLGRTLKVLADSSTAANGDAKEWIEEFRAWVHGHSPSTPLLSDDAISREMIYADRGL